MDDRSLEEKVRELVTAGYVNEAAGLALYGTPSMGLRSGHGERVYGYLRGIIKNGDDADAVFSDFAMDVLDGMGGFRWDASLKTWLYAVAYRAALRFWRGHEKRRERPIGENEDFSQRARTNTANYKKTTVKDRFRELRLMLPQEDQTILILRVDRGLTWEEVARVLLDENQVVDGALLERQVNRVKQRFVRAKEKLRVLAEEAGLMAKGV
jgi:RNA polymerase sigma-70 factor, ECF subfamily